MTTHPHVPLSTISGLPVRRDTSLHIRIGQMSQWSCKRFLLFRVCSCFCLAPDKYRCDPFTLANLCTRFTSQPRPDNGSGLRSTVSSKPTFIKRADGRWHRLIHIILVIHIIHGQYLSFKNSATLPVRQRVEIVIRPHTYFTTACSSTNEALSHLPHLHGLFKTTWRGFPSYQ